ncbi:MAG: hypothetical protein U0414_44430 [Polyangiaceae bacterium]
MNSANALLLFAPLSALALACSSTRTDAEARAAMRARAAAAASASAASPIATPAPPVTAAPTALSPGGKDFAEEVKLLYRVVACSGDAPLPANIDPPSVEAYCTDLHLTMDRYEKRYIEVARPFLKDLQPKDLPKRVVYPFSGGDLVTALTTYGDAESITTLSLELAGDPRRLKTINRESLRVSLGKLRMQLGELFDVDDFSRSETLKKTQRGEIPGELAFFLVSLAAHHMEPVSLRYFTLEGDGSVHYLEEAEIAQAEAVIAENRKGTWLPPDFSESFANVEIAFRPAGDASAPLRIHRHIAVNLANDHLSGTPNVLAYLAQQGDVAAMTKAASYLLWQDGFSTIRDYLIQHAVFMVSDSTGIPSGFAASAGLEQDTYGSFTASLLAANLDYNAAFKKLWAEEPQRTLPFRFGYRDRSGKDHMLVTKRK